MRRPPSRKERRRPPGQEAAAKSTTTADSLSLPRDLRAAALAYAEAGYEVFPLRGKLPHRNCAECNPKSPRYRPHKGADCTCTREWCHGLLAATSDLERIERHWSRHPQDGIGARVPRKLIVLDVDPRNHGDHTLDALEDTHGPLPPTRTSWSGRGDGGRHLWFLHPGGAPSAARLGRGLDLKTHAGYVVLPPSPHPSTSMPYRWDRPLLDPASLPPWCVRLLLPPAPQPRPSRIITHRVSDPGASPGTANVADRYAATHSWAQVLGEGWRCLDPDGDADGARWQHPNATHTVSATIRHGLLFVYSQATEFEPTEAEHPRGYTKFRAYAVLEHRGDLSAAAKALHAQAVTA